MQHVFHFNLFHFTELIPNIQEHSNYESALLSPQTFEVGKCYFYLRINVDKLYDVSQTSQHQWHKVGILYLQNLSTTVWLDQRPLFNT